MLLGIAGLAALDAFNPATILTVALILIAAPRRPGLTAAAAVAGAALTVFAAGGVLFLTAGAAAGAVDGVVTLLRFLAFGAASVALAIAGIRRFRDRARRPIGLPAWFTPWTALPFGAVITAADLPNAFPYFIAIERMVDAGLGPGEGLAVLAGYTLVYCLPCLVLLAIGLAAREPTRARLQRLIDRFGSGVVRRSVPIGLLLLLAAIAVAVVPFLLR
nr:GAP family protein [Agromyces luteolus]